MAIRDLAGTGALQEALGTTNEHLAGVLSELQRINDERLLEISAQLSALNDKIEQFLSSAQR